MNLPKTGQKTEQTELLPMVKNKKRKQTSNWFLSFAVTLKPEGVRSPQE